MFGSEHCPYMSRLEYQDNYLRERQTEPEFRIWLNPNISWTLQHINTVLLIFRLLKQSGAFSIDWQQKYSLFSFFSTPTYWHTVGQTLFFFFVMQIINWKYSARCETYRWRLAEQYPIDVHKKHENDPIMFFTQKSTCKLLRYCVSIFNNDEILDRSINLNFRQKYKLEFLLDTYESSYRTLIEIIKMLLLMYRTVLCTYSLSARCISSTR